MRASFSVVVVVLLLAGCATSTTPIVPAPAEPEGRVAAQRCSASDPDRFAWFCVIGRALYGAAAFMQPDSFRPR